MIVSCNYSSASATSSPSALTFPCWRDNFKSCTWLYSAHICSVVDTSQFSDKLKNGWGEIKMADLSQFTSLILQVKWRRAIVECALVLAFVVPFCCVIRVVTPRLFIGWHLYLSVSSRLLLLYQLAVLLELWHHDSSSDNTFTCLCHLGCCCCFSLLCCWSCDTTTLHRMTPLPVFII